MKNKREDIFKNQKDLTVITTISIKKFQKDFLKNEGIILSVFVRQKLDELIEEIKKEKRLAK